ncbi:hypothetical protein BDF20DRAFT_497250 [Mycotypha africana]|uniref:uncharacterized protein n=1 Tax=Mycotypha africana TaxID=64632 RepID=UPI002301E52B|nr:uncharacterized protein BDF20DRAFT_497250 [Mycotypha africana]KAI8979334.1 hypothetical protein BDF20DRAFT_497250 [Mycotypha africana]
MQLFTKFYPNVLQDNPLLLLKLRCRKFLDMVQKAQSDAIQGTSTNYDEYQTDNLRISAKEKNTGEKRGLREDGIPSGRTKKKQKVTKDSAKRTGHLNDALAYGICLRQEYEDKMAVDPIVYSELMTSFSALAYTDLSNPAVAHLYSPQYTERIASEVYSAILVSLGENPTSSLERLYRQTRLVMEESVITGNGKAALINLDQDCLR